MSWVQPELLWLLLLAPLTGWGVAWLLRRRRRAEHEWISGALQPRLRRGGPARPTWVLVGLSVWVVAACVAALARPRWGTIESQHERRGVDLVLVLDTSLSMAAPDVQPNRFFVAQALVRRLLEALPGHRFGLVQVEGISTVLIPLTEDTAAIELLVDALEPASAPVPGTLLAPALEHALTLFPEGDQRNRVVVLLSDGEDHGSPVAAIQRKLAESGVVVHALGIGTLRGSPIPLPGQPGEVKRDLQGQVVVTHLRPETLQSLASETGGLYLEAPGATVDLSSLIGEIRKLRGRVRSIEVKTAAADRFQLPLLAALLGTLGWLWLEPNRPHRRRRRRATATGSLLTVLLASSPLAGTPTQETAPSSDGSAAPRGVERWLFNPRERTNQGLHRLQAGDAEGALAPFDGAARLAPQDTRTRYNRESSRLFADREINFEELEAVAREAPEPLAVKAWYNLGNGYLAKQEYGRAIRAYREALLRQPDFVPAKQNLELALQAQQRQPQNQGPRNPPPSAEEPRSEPQPGPGELDRERPSKPSPKEFQDQPDLNAEQAAALLAASEQLEKQAQKEARAREAKRRNIRDRDW